MSATSKPGPFTCRSQKGDLTLACGRPHASANAALGCAKARAGTSLLGPQTQAAALQDGVLVRLALSIEKQRLKGRGIDSRASWAEVPVVGGVADAATLRRLTKDGPYLGELLILDARAKAQAGSRS